MEIIPRARWGARYQAGFGPSPLPARELWLHHSVTTAPDLVWVDADGDGVEDDEERAMRTLEDIGQQRFGGGISYTFAVMPSGRIYEGHGVGRQGAHTGGRNDIARAIVLVGDYSTRPPTVAQQKAVAWLTDHGRRQGWWTVTGLSGGHRQAPNQIATACPGDAALREIPAINRTVAEYRAGTVSNDEENELNTAQNNALSELYHVVVSGEKRNGRLNLDLGYVRDTILGQVAGLTAAVNLLATKVGEADGASAEEIKAAVAEAIRENVVKVDVSVSGTES
jgi:hypothetical protein